jgi:hypothetical protein
MQQDNKSNARFLGKVIGESIYIDHMDQYQQFSVPLFVEDTLKKPNPDELSDQDLSAQKTQNLKQ